MKFHNTFGVVRPNMGGGIKISPNGWHHLSYTERTATGQTAQRLTAQEQVPAIVAGKD